MKNSYLIFVIAILLGLLIFLLIKNKNCKGGGTGGTGGTCPSAPTTHTLISTIKNDDINKTNTDNINPTDLNNLLNHINNVDTNLESVSIENINKSIMYTELLNQFLISNSNLSPETISNCQKILHNLNKYKSNNNQVNLIPLQSLELSESSPLWEEILNWIKNILEKMGGVPAILLKFHQRIKYDFIQSVMDEQKSNVNTSGDIFGTGHCTAYPLNLWQNCPSGSIQVDSRGWNKDPTKSACNKWYQHLSGEMLCQKINTQDYYNKPLGGSCSTILKGISNLEKLWGNPTIHDLIAKLLAMALAAANAVPQIAAIISIVQTIFKLVLPLLGSWKDYKWILDDFQDVCYNFICQGNNATTVCNGKYKYCYPQVTDTDTLANRNCDIDKNCNTKPSGKCLNTIP
jgi:hypothetical protein